MQSNQYSSLIITYNDEAQSYLDWLPTSSTLAYFKIENTDTNSTVYDKSSKGNNATWQGTASYETLATWKRVLNLTGSQGLYCNNPVITTSPYTIVVRMYRNQNNSSDATIVSNQNDNGSRGTVLAYNGSNQLFSFFGNGSSWQTTNNVVNVDMNRRICYGFTVSGSTIKKYMSDSNGNISLVQTVNASGTPNFTNATNLSVGFLRSNGSQSNFRYLKGKLSSVVIENRSRELSDFQNFCDKTKKKFWIN